MLFTETDETNIGHILNFVFASDQTFFDIFLWNRWFKFVKSGIDLELSDLYRWYGKDQSGLYFFSKTLKYLLTSVKAENCFKISVYREKNLAGL